MLRRARTLTKGLVKADEGILEYRGWEIYRSPGLGFSGIETFSDTQEDSVKMIRSSSLENLIKRIDLDRKAEQAMKK